MAGKLSVYLVVEAAVGPPSQQLPPIHGRAQVAEQQGMAKPALTLNEEGYDKSDFSEDTPRRDRLVMVRQVAQGMPTPTARRQT